MKPEIRDAFLEGLEDVLKQVGEESYDAAFAKLIRATERFLYALNLFRTKEHAAVVLDLMADPSAEEEPFAVSFGRFLPQLAAMSVGQVIQEFIKEATKSKGGRPRSMHYDAKVGIVREIGRLITEGYTASVAKRHAARKFKVSIRSAERAWQQRGQILDGDREVTLEEAKDWFNRVLQQPGPLLPEVPIGHKQNEH